MWSILFSSSVYSQWSDSVSYGHSQEGMMWRWRVLWRPGRSISLSDSLSSLCSDISSCSSLHGYTDRDFLFRSTQVVWVDLLFVQKFQKIFELFYNNHIVQGDIRMIVLDSSTNWLSSLILIHVKYNSSCQQWFPWISGGNYSKTTRYLMSVPRI